MLAELSDARFMGTGDVARDIGAPQNYLGKLLQRLVREGVVESQKGSGGGFRLARRPEKIRLVDVVEPIEHLERWSGCFLGRPHCGGRQPCSLHERWKALRQQYLDLLRQTSLAEVVGHGLEEVELTVEQQFTPKVNGTGRGDQTAGPELKGGPPVNSPPARRRRAGGSH